VITHLTTERLLLRGWTAADRAPFAALNADPEVMEHFPAPLSRAESDAMVDRVMAGLAERGWGLWAVQVRATGEFAGFVGLNPAPDELPVAPAVEVGWRLAGAHWGQGFAPEAARAAIDFGFGQLALPELVSFTTTVNLNSRRVMEKLGMTHDPVDDFDHPRLPDWPERRHVLYRLRAAEGGLSTRRTG
jgi:RimJ/RimL family protein N-acetyltransferase